MIAGGIVRADPLSVGILHVHAEILEDFQALRAAALYIVFEPRRGALAVTGSVDVVVAQVGEDHEAVGMAPLHRGYGLPQLLAGAAAQVHHDAQVDAVHFFRELVGLLWRGIPVMAVNVNERKLRALDFVFFGDQR